MSSLFNQHLFKIAMLVLASASLVSCGVYGTTVSAGSSAASVTEIVTPSPTEGTPLPMAEGGFVGPGCYVDRVNHLNLWLTSGWNAYTSRGIGVGGTTLFNYGPNDVKPGADSFPPGGVKIEISSTKLKPDQSFEQWLSDWAVPKTEGVVLPPAEYQPYTLGKYDAVSRLVSNDTGGSLEIILPLPDDRIVVIGVSPADSSAISDALSVLSTLDATGSCPSSAAPTGEKKRNPAASEPSPNSYTVCLSDWHVPI